MVAVCLTAPRPALPPASGSYLHRKHLGDFHSYIQSTHLWPKLVSSGDVAVVQVARSWFRGTRGPQDPDGERERRQRADAQVAFAKHVRGPIAI